MAIIYKVLGQSNPAANTNADLYTVPSATSAVCSTLVVCNQSSTAASFSIAVRPSGAAISNTHYLAFNSNLNSNDSVTLTIGMTLAATDVVTVRASTTSVSFNLFGSEIV
jgi:hypothetical protein